MRCDGSPWSKLGDDGKIVATLSLNDGLFRIPASGGTPVRVSRLVENERAHRWPQVLPGSQAVLLTVVHGSASGVILTYDDANIDVLSINTGVRKTVQHGGFSGRYLPSKHLIYINQNTLFAAPFDLEHLSLKRTPVAVVEDVGSTVQAGGDFGFSQTGTFIYLNGKGLQAGWPISLLDGTSNARTLLTPPGINTGPRFSPDGKRLAFSLGRLGSDIWVKSLDRDTPSRLSFLPGVNSDPVWTPDGNAIVFYSDNPSAPGLYWMRADGSGTSGRLTAGELHEIPYSFSPDGKRLAYQQQGSGGATDIVTAAIETDQGTTEDRESGAVSGNAFQ